MTKRGLINHLECLYTVPDDAEILIWWAVGSGLRPINEIEKFGGGVELPTGSRIPKRIILLAGPECR
jgi:hypothetical protein